MADIAIWVGTMAGYIAGTMMTLLVVWAHSKR